MNMNLQDQRSLAVSRLLKRIDLSDADAEGTWEFLTDNVCAELRTLGAILFAIDQLYVEMDGPGDNKAEFYDRIAYLILKAMDMTKSLGGDIECASAEIRKIASGSRPTVR